MKFATYLLLVGAVSGACTSVEKVAALEKRAAATKAYAAAVAKKTAEVETYSKGLTPFQTDVNEKTDALKKLKAQVPAAATGDVTKAESNLQAAKALLSSYIAKEGHAAHHAIVAEMEKTKKAQDVSFEAAFRAIDACVPDAVTQWETTNLAKVKTAKGYDKLSATDKEEFDKWLAERKAKVAAMDAELKYKAKYHEMTEQEQGIYDKMLIAQRELRAEEGAKRAKAQGADALKEKFAAMTAEQQKAFKAKWAEKMKAGDAKGDGRFKDGMDARAKAGYFKGMKDSERGMFDKKAAALRKGRDADDGVFKARLVQMKTKAGFDKLTAAKKVEWLKDRMDDRKGEEGRKDQYRKEDDEQRTKAGYFKKMTEGQRGVYDKKEEMVKKMRGADDKRWDAKRDEERKQGGWDKMIAKKKEEFMGSFDKQRGAAAQQRFKDRTADEVQRGKERYYSLAPEARAKADAVMKLASGKRDTQRMQLKVDAGTGGIGDQCNPDLKAGPPAGEKTGVKRDAGVKPAGGAEGQRGGRPGGQMGGATNHGCQASLCCGNTHEGGIWQAKWVCNTKTAATYNDFRFACYKDAKKLAAGVVSLFAAAYMMA